MTRQESSAAELPYEATYVIHVTKQVARWERLHARLVREALDGGVERLDDTPLRTDASVQHLLHERIEAERRVNAAQLDALFRPVQLMNKNRASGADAGLPCRRACAHHALQAGARRGPHGGAHPRERCAPRPLAAAVAELPPDWDLLMLDSLEAGETEAKETGIAKALRDRLGGKPGAALRPCAGRCTCSPVRTSCGRARCAGCSGYASVYHTPSPRRC